MNIPYDKTIMEYIKKYRSFIIYISVGFVGLSVDFLLFLFLVKVLYVLPLIANPITMSLGIVTNFFLNAHFNFKKTDKLLKRLLMFYSVGILGIIVSNTIIYIFHNVLHGPIELVKAGAIVIIAVSQYFLNSKIAFKA